MSDKIYVCDGAVLQCDQGFTPAELKVTENRKIRVQGKLKATDMDRQVPKTFGKCKLKPTNSDYLPCVPALQKWTKTSKKTTLGKNKKFLFHDSECMCSTGGKITITDPLQVDSAGSVAEEFIQIARMLPGAILGADHAPKVVESYWMDEEASRKIKNSEYGENACFFVRTENIDTGETLEIEMTDKERQDLDDGRQQIIYSGIVQADGTAELQSININKIWQQTEKET